MTLTWCCSISTGSLTTTRSRPCAVCTSWPSTAGLAVPTGFTALALAGRRHDLERLLLPWLPYRLRGAGLTVDLDEPLALRFLAFIVARLAEVERRPFRACFPGWLRGFAEEEG